MPRKNQKKRILILSANPKLTSKLRLDEEVREIDQALRRAQKRDRFELIQRWAVTPRELQRAILEETPEIVHFSGHGLGEEGLVLENEIGQVQLVNGEALARLFELFADHVKCVVLNACYAEIQAEVIKQHIDYVIGMNQPIGDQAAIEFAVGFYDAVGAAKDYEFAYKLGCSSIRLAGIQEADTPVLKKKADPASLWIHAWLKQNYANTPTLELDWTQHFDMKAKPRRIADQETWDNILLPSLEKARNYLTQGKSALTVDIRGRLPLSAAFAIGHTFQDTEGYTLQVEQRTLGKDELWRSDVTASDAKFKVIKQKGEVGEHLLFALAITGDASTDVEHLYNNSSIKYSSIVYAEPELGVGEKAITSNADAIALAINAKALIRQYRQQYGATYIHLILFAPVGFCLFLGQRSRVIGDVVCYEFVADNNYKPSLKFSTC
ncbi:MAG: SAVED domain-containing protein [Nostoc sp.]